MKVIKPIPYATSMLVSSNAVETTPDWLIGTTYALNAEVHYSNSIYVSLQASNTGHQPDTSPTWWIRKGADNIQAMFDDKISSQTIRATPLEVSVEPGEIFNSVALLNISGATSLEIEVTDGIGGSVYYTKTIDLDDTPIVDWYMYFFEPYDFMSEVILTDIPPYSTGVINASLTNAAGNIAVGNMIFGNFYELGLTQIGANAGIRDYSIKQTNEFGDVVFIPRAFSRRMDVSLFVQNNQLRFLSKFLTDIRAIPVLWIGTDYEDYSPLIVYGFYRDYSIDIAYPSHSLARIEVEGLT